MYCFSLFRLYMFLYFWHFTFFRSSYFAFIFFLYFVIRDFLFRFLYLFDPALYLYCPIVAVINWAARLDDHRQGLCSVDICKNWDQPFARRGVFFLSFVFVFVFLYLESYLLKVLHQIVKEGTFCRVSSQEQSRGRRFEWFPTKRKKPRFARKTFPKETKLLQSKHNRRCMEFPRFAPKTFQNKGNSFSVIILQSYYRVSTITDKQKSSF